MTTKEWEMKLKFKEDIIRFQLEKNKSLTERCEWVEAQWKKCFWACVAMFPFAIYGIIKLIQLL